MRTISEVIGVIALYTFTFTAMVLLSITIANIGEHFINFFNQTLFQSRYIAFTVVAAGWWLLSLFLSFTIHITCGGGLSNQEIGENVALATAVFFAVLGVAFLGWMITTAFEMIVLIFN